MFALVDCNNFYCSCERVFDPKLDGRPVIVLSNNDGCAIARSEEAKQVGIVMGTPEYMIRDLIKEHNVAVFSSNYTLYGDMSDRVMKLLASFVPRLELYSIDEAFLDMSELAYENLLELGMRIRTTVTQSTGIPVTVGIAPTKVLAKMANRFAKKKRKDIGVHWLGNDYLIREALEATDVGDIWGVGHQYSTMLVRNGFKTAADLVNAPEDFVREKMSVVGHRLIKELKGIPAIEWEFEPKKKKNICTSRSFGSLTQSKDVMIEAVSNYAALCAGKLRKEKSCARELIVFVKTNQFRTQDKQYEHAIRMQMEVATNNTVELIKYALKGLDIVFKDGYNYQKCGVIVNDLVPETEIQFGMFDQVDRKKNNTVMHALDKVNQAFGKDIVRFAVQRFDKRYRLNARFLSKKYTTDINEVLHVKI
ncbi:Y-family DNA polymerase [Foetidibacter luteolus]|uniref:Y-family DNA polymerase n=1 Tax=Foetidibacter luteolus TaxID=2608880 RepID=UPI00129B61A8|nr:Y-family DNA polymerase [Foetidibacter luteolus]